MREITVIMFAAAMLGCSSESESGSAAGQAPTSAGSATFSVEDSAGGGFDQDSERARVHWVYDSLVALRSRTGRVSIDANGLPEAGEGETDDLSFNNTSYSMTIPIEGESVSVSCKPARDPKGRFVRSAMADGMISGSFEAVFVACTDGNTGQPIEVPDLPITVTGRFSNLPLTQ